MSATDFRTFQFAFGSYLRDPTAVARPAGVSARRARAYVTLLSNNLYRLLGAAFPVSRQIVGVRRFRRYTRDFFREYRSSAPYFHRIAEAFLEWLQTRADLPEDMPPFLPELLHYEWVELALATSQLDAHLPSHDPNGNLLVGNPLLNPVAMILAYRWPVHRLSSRFKPTTPPVEPTFIAAWRDAGFVVRFMILDTFAAHLLDALERQTSLSGEQLIGQIVDVTEAIPESLRRRGLDALEDWRQRGLILGTVVPVSG